MATHQTSQAESEHLKSDESEKHRRLKQSGFYRFLRQHRDVVVTLNPSLNELEVIAFLQAKWESLTDKSSYELVEKEDDGCNNGESEEKEAG